MMKMREFEVKPFVFVKLGWMGSYKKAVEEGHRFYVMRVKHGRPSVYAEFGSFEQAYDFFHGRGFHGGWIQSEVGAVCVIGW